MSAMRFLTTTLDMTAGAKWALPFVVVVGDSDSTLR
jgi:hypothetical protein